MKIYISDLYKFVKHKCVKFSISNKRNLFSFFIIHNGIWGLYHIPNIYETRWFASFVDNCTTVT